MQVKLNKIMTTIKFSFIVMVIVLILLILLINTTVTPFDFFGIIHIIYNFIEKTRSQHRFLEKFKIQQT